jgi:hypothetical protein
MRYFIFFSALLGLHAAHADSPIYSSGYQYNNNVKIDRTFVRATGTVVKLSNNNYCWTTETERTLIAAILLMDAQASYGNFVCEETATGQEEGQNTRRLVMIVK